MTLYKILSIKNLIMLSVAFYLLLLLNVDMLIVIMLNVVMLSVAMLNAVIYTECCGAPGPRPPGGPRPH